MPDAIDHAVAETGREFPGTDLQTSEISVRVAHLARLFDKIIEEAIAPYDIPVGELDVLGALRRAGPPFELTPTGLVNTLMRSPTAMTNRVDRLERRGLVERLASSTDRRVVLVRLTDAGHALIEQAFGGVNRLESKILAELPAETRQHFLECLRLVTATLEAWVDLAPSESPDGAS